ncbi:MAG: tripartite tricarboxylate transporter TctB family protein [Devosia sp.]
MTEPSVPHAPKRRPDVAALIIAAALALLGAVIAWDAARLGTGGAYARIGPQTVPYVIAVCLGILAVWTVFEAWRGDFPEREPQELAPVAWIVGGLLIQLLLIKTVGFSIATAIMFALTARGLGRVSLPFALLVGLVLCTAIWFLFARVLQLSLPTGPLEHLILDLLTPPAPGASA